MKALVLMANGFEEVECITQVDFLRRAGIEVTTASIHEERMVEGGHRVSVKADALLKDVNEDEYDIAVLPGGGVGMQNLKASEAVASLLKKFYQEEKWIAAICASPVIFGGLGFLKGRRCVCYPGMEEGLAGGIVVSDPVAVDGKVITSKGPATSLLFALKMIEMLCGKAAADQVAADAQYSK